MAALLDVLSVFALGYLAAGVVFFAGVWAFIGHAPPKDKRAKVVIGTIVLWPYLLWVLITDKDAD